MPTRYSHNIINYLLKVWPLWHLGLVTYYLLPITNMTKPKSSHSMTPVPGTAFLKNDDIVIYSGFYTPLAVHHHQHGHNMLILSHTAPIDL
ncbi:MAG: hypothetical protein DRR08_02080 [Candidatus Parabeggiatoa sp. nov. 2]|nr:MAG: hypothetical protein B6247_07945 [Beggiatoa sp. 4572_84]RKZ63981.1 MAG: hypothetical protein DRR08_02080 [Gammaproteobacteria bacterium]